MKSKEHFLSYHFPRWPDGVKIYHVVLKFRDCAITQAVNSHQQKWNSSLSLNLEIGQATNIWFVIIINSMARGKSSTAKKIIIQNEILWQAPILSMIG